MELSARMVEMLMGHRLRFADSRNPTALALHRRGLAEFGGGPMDSRWLLTQKGMALVALGKQLQRTTNPANSENHEVLKS